jgi:D-alanyl-D-alanine dipeptidase
MLQLNRPFKELKLFILLCLFIYFCISCQHQSTKVSAIIKTQLLLISPTVQKPCDSFSINYEKTLQHAGMVNLATFDSSIMLSLRYATTHNFLNINVYHGCTICYVHRTTAAKIKRAQSYIKALHPHYSIIIFDATRPCSVQQFMWDSAKMNIDDKRKFLSNPHNRSLHNYGLAVDCSLCDSTGKELDMGTAFDFAGEKAYPCLEQILLTTGKLSQTQIDNRKLLRTAMVKAGFSVNGFEWWHFNSCNRTIAKKTAACIIDFNTFEFPKSDIVVSPQEATGLVFKVQIAALPRSIDKKNSISSGLMLECYIQDALYKYTVGRCSTIQKAYLLQDSLTRVGFKNAFIVCFKDGKRIAIKDIIQ